MFLLSERNVDRTLFLAPLAAIAPFLFFIQIRFLLPLGWNVGLLTLYSLFTLGVCSSISEMEIRLRNVDGCRPDANLPYPHVFLHRLLAVFRGDSERLARSEGAALWRQVIQRAIDLAMSFGVMQYAIRLAWTVFVENLKRTGDQPLKWW
jgi:hypothetical protein